MATTSTSGDKKPWWLFTTTTKIVVDRKVREARGVMISSSSTTQLQQQCDVALDLLEAALSLSPLHDLALELKARTLLYLRRYADVADMLLLHLIIPTAAAAAADSGDEFLLSSSSSSSSSEKEDQQSKLLSSSPPESLEEETIKCFSVSHLKIKKFMSALCNYHHHHPHPQPHWRYLVLGQACFHLGLMEDALLLLQTGRLFAVASLRRRSSSQSDDTFTFSHLPISSENKTLPPPKTELETVSPLLTHIKQLLRRKSAALAALGSGLYSESIRHFSKILGRGGPQAFLADCYVYRATAYKSSNRLADSIADCNKALSLDPSSTEALSTRAVLFESIRCFSDSLHDLEHLKLLYNSILRNRKLPGPVWRKNNFCYDEIPGKLSALAHKIQELKVRASKGETANIDYYTLIGLRRGCSRSELSRSHLLLMLRHKPDRSNGFVERCEFADERDVSSVRESAKMSALLLYRLIQKGYTSLMAVVLEEEATEKQRVRTKAALQAAIEEAQQISLGKEKQIKLEAKKTEKKADLAVYQGVFCRDIAVVGNLLSQVGFDRPISLKYEALSC